MRIKTYTSDSVPQALKQIQNELGPGAVILKTNRTVKKKFLGLIPTLAYEITAAAETGTDTIEEPKRAVDQDILKLAESVVDQSNVEEKVDDPNKVDRQSSASKTTGETYEVATSPPRLEDRSEHSQSWDERSANNRMSNQWTHQIEKISIDIESLIRLISRQNTYQPMNSLLMREDALTARFQRMIWQTVENTKQAAAIYNEFRRLASDGVEENLAFLLLQEAAAKLPADDEIRERLRLRLNRAIANSFQVSHFCPDEGPRSCIFVGPTGVGKTTTLAKIAARMALKERRKVRLITYDTYRIAAAEQLRIYGEIIGVPVRVLYSIAELHEAISEARPDECTLIDTTGHSHKRIAEYSELASFIRNHSEIETHLVLSTSTRSRDLNEVIESFEMFGPEKLIFTKLDETSSYGVILNELIRTEKPLSYLTDGQDVAEDLIVPSEATLADLLVPIC